MLKLENMLKITEKGQREHGLCADYRSKHRSWFSQDFQSHSGPHSAQLLGPGVISLLKGCHLMPQRSHASYAALLSAQSELSYGGESLRRGRGANLLLQRVWEDKNQCKDGNEMCFFFSVKKKTKQNTKTQEALLLVFHCLMILLGDLIHASFSTNNILHSRCKYYCHSNKIRPDSPNSLNKPSTLLLVGLITCKATETALLQMKRWPLEFSLFFIIN